MHETVHAMIERDARVKWFCEVGQGHSGEVDLRAIARWQGVRKIKTGWETADLFAFLTTDPSEPVKSIHPKAMPVILTQPDEIEAWMTAPWAEAQALQRPLPDGALEMI